MFRQFSPVAVPVGIQGGRRGFNIYDLVAAGLILAFLLAFADASRHMAAPIAAESRPISLSPWDLPLYALRSTMRMLAAMAASLVFTFAFASLAAKSRRAETVLVPLLDILQSVPILGFISVTVTASCRWRPAGCSARSSRRSSPSSPARPGTWPSASTSRCAPFPTSCNEAARSPSASRPGCGSGGSRCPSRMPALIWNMMMSMSGGWFFVVASRGDQRRHDQLRCPASAPTSRSRSSSAI